MRDWDDEADPAPDDDIEIIPSPSEGFPEEGEGSLASVGQRAIARFIDVFIVFNVAGILSVILVRPADDDTSLGTTILLATVFLLIAGIYETAMVAWRGQPVGKWLLGIRVARYSDGDTPLVTEALVRFLVPSLPLYIPYVGQVIWIGVYLTSIPNERKQGFHDRAAGTVVVRAR